MARQSFLVLLLFLHQPQVQTKAIRTDDPEPLQAVVQQLSSDVSSLQAQMIAQKAKIAELEEYKNRTVAFSAYVSDEPHVSASQGSTIPFHGVISNIGGAYNPSSSIFTTTTDGHYFFLVHADCSSDYSFMGVAVNGHVVFEADNDGHDNSHITGSGVLNLRVGDTVSALHITSDGYLDAGTESTFSGFLVK